MSSEENDYQPLQFAPFVSCVNPGFWSAFSKLKLEVLGLDEEPVDVLATYSNNTPPGVSQIFNLDWDALKAASDSKAGSSGNAAPPWNTYLSRGQLFNFNTIDSFKSCNKSAFLKKRCDEVWSRICDGTALVNPDLLNTFSVLMFSDLKKYHYYYWFNYPSFSLPADVKVHKSIKKITELYSQDVCQDICNKYALMKKVDGATGISVFGINVDQQNNVKILSLEEALNQPAGDVEIAFADPSSLETHPGWPLRNLLLLICKHNDRLLRDGLDIVCFRQRVSDQRKLSIDSSLVLRVKLLSTEPLDLTVDPKGVGWEMNDKGKAGPKFSNMRSSMDPTQLASSSVDLNLKLMKWRMVPQLDLDRLSQLRCLLLGSGTLGCNVARCLMGWGVRNITLVDNGKVSFSNPVRQSLFTFQDCLEGGKPKAEAAADALKQIFPAVKAKGVTLSIPMPGHPISESTHDEVQSAFQLLEQMITSHDVIYLLMDSRESRWLPTLMSAHHGKLVINAALGYDSYLVMRHGVRNESSHSLPPGAQGGTASDLVPGNRLGCYFCNDVVAPGNSTRDRSLDQQCTVTRPGVSSVAAALAVELMVNVLQHEQGSEAPAPKAKDIQDPIQRHKAEGLMGQFVPHSIRGSIYSMDQFHPTTELFSNCTACSSSVIKCYGEDGFALMCKACNSPNYLEDLTGLSKLLSEANMDDLEIDFSGSEEDF